MCRYRLGMVDELMDVLVIECRVRLERIRHDFRTGLDMLPDDGIERLALAILDGAGAHARVPVRPVSLQEPQYGGLADHAAPGDLLGALVLVHVPRFAADERL